MESGIEDTAVVEGIRISPTAIPTITFGVILAARGLYRGIKYNNYKGLTVGLFASSILIYGGYLHPQRKGYFITSPFLILYGTSTIIRTLYKRDDLMGSALMAVTCYGVYVVDNWIQSLLLPIYLIKQFIKVVEYFLPEEQTPSPQQLTPQ